jgi:hypothetical protein
MKERELIKALEEKAVFSVQDISRTINKIKKLLKNKN